MNWLVITLLITFSLAGYGNTCAIPGHCGESIVDNQEISEPPQNKVETNNQALAQENQDKNTESTTEPITSTQTEENHSIKTQEQAPKAAVDYIANTRQDSPSQVQATESYDLPYSNTEPEAPAPSADNTDDHTPKLLYFILIVFVFITYKFLKSREEKQAHREAINDALRISYSIIDDHLDELKKLRSQLTVKGDFNIINDEKWQKKKQEFIEVKIYPEITRFDTNYHDDLRKILSFLYRELDDKTSDYRRLTLSFSEVHTPIDFELLIASNLRSQGWEAETTKASGDQGVDVLAKKGNIDIAIQCKLYSTPVGNDAVQQVIAGRGFYKTKYAAVVTNSTYTTSAKQLAQSMNVLLLHHSELKKLDTLTDNFYIK